MDFFGHQDKAKTRTFLLVSLFIIGLALLSIVTTFAINLVLMATLDAHATDYISYWPILGAIVGITLLVTFFKHLSLRAGGKVVAEALGGRLISRSTRDTNERRLLNLVDEMAIAARLPAPPVYLLDDEPNINAFAAGHTVNNAVIGITKGALELLTRDELQAVIGHEFSHILNGDMRINLRFTAMIFGFLYITQAATIIMRASQYLRASRSNNKNAAAVMAAIFLISIILFIAGWLTSLWARIMQAAINRQREYLADASSVQFTRQGMALASALKKIGGSVSGSSLQTASAQSYNHLLFGQGDEHLLATHPSLTKRILRLDPLWDGEFIVPVRINVEPTTEDETEHAKETFSKENIVKAITTGAAISMGLPTTAEQTAAASSSKDNETPLVKIAALCQQPMGACYLVFAYLLDNNPDKVAKQVSLIKNTELLNTCTELLAAIPNTQHLSFIEKAILTIKTLTPEQYQDFKKIMMQLINIAGDISLHEWLIYQLVTHQIEYSPSTEVKYHSLDQLQPEITTLLSALAYLSPTENTIKSSFGMGANIMGLYTIQLQPNPAITELSNCLQKLQQSSSSVRYKFLQGILKAIQQDKTINLEEATFFRVLSICLDYPMELNNAIPSVS
ncbi:M48 family metallopeptidase [Entomomonas asaccharolytica]|uniref:M48 family metalloprotease n=1 Tax=Entomomonas asaccharolytica TaxID=2785331 RepID=A0A974ND28_9GAMM|nr:M48 family metallopeptidase [Entomomonas asaccharolytica]QQP84495.1 M48 family metalloprotease [Entomomonas asaccharolytica]